MGEFLRICWFGLKSTDGSSGYIWIDIRIYIYGLYIWIYIYMDYIVLFGVFSDLKFLRDGSPMVTPLFSHALEHLEFTPRLRVTVVLRGMLAKKSTWRIRTRVCWIWKNLEVPLTRWETSKRKHQRETTNRPNRSHPIDGDFWGRLAAMACTQTWRFTSSRMLRGEPRWPAETERCLVNEDIYTESIHNRILTVCELENHHFSWVNHGKST